MTAAASISPPDESISQLDESVSDAVQDWRGRLDEAMLLVTELGGEEAMAMLTVVAVAGLALRGRTRAAWFVAIASGGSLLLNTVVSRLIGRARPTGPRYIVKKPGSYSFPSGHAMACVSTIASLVIVTRPSITRRRVQLALLSGFLASSASGASRIYFGVHFPTDIVGGQIAGAVWIAAVCRHLDFLLRPSARDRAARVFGLLAAARR